MISLITFVSFSDDETTAPTTSYLELDITGLEDLGANYKYEEWVVFGDIPVSRYFY